VVGWTLRCGAYTDLSFRRQNKAPKKRRPRATITTKTTTKTRRKRRRKRRKRDKTFHLMDEM
jgi:hypothetical protein